MPRTVLLLLPVLALIGVVAFFALGPRDSEELPAALGLEGPTGALSPGESAAADLALADAQGGERAAAARAAIELSRAAAARERAQGQGVAVRLATGPLRGRLVDTSGAPIADAALELRPWSEREVPQFRFGVMGPKPWPTTKTGKDGRFTVAHDDRLGRSLAVIAKARGYVDQPVQALVEDAAEPDLGDVRIPRGVIVQGIVRDDRGGPVSGAKIQRGRGEDERVARAARQMGFGGLFTLAETDEQGRFELPHAAPGTLNLVAAHDEYRTANWSGDVGAAGATFPLVELEMARTGSIRGTVLGFPAERVSVRVEARKVTAEGGRARRGMGDASTEVGTDGAFALHGLDLEGAYELRVMDRPIMREAVVLSQAVTADVGARNVLLDYDLGARLTLRLLDRTTQRPVEVAEVTGRFTEAPARVFVAPDLVTRPTSFPGGKVTIYELRPPQDPSALILKVTAPGYITQELPSVDVGARSVLDLGDVELVPAPRLKLLVVDATTGKGISRAQVTLREEVEREGESEGQQGRMGFFASPDAAGRRQRDRTSRDGRIELDGLTVPAAKLTIRADGYPTYTDAKFPAQDTSREHRIQLYKSGVLDVYVVDPTGQPVSGARVLRRRGDGQGRESGDDTNGDGLVRWDTLDAGRYEVRAYRRGANPADTPGAEVEWTQADLLSGRDTEVVLTVGGAARVFGQVTLGGQPLADARVSLAQRGSDSAQRERDRARARFGGARSGATLRTSNTDPEGRYDILEAVPGEFLLVVRHESLAAEHTEPVNLSAGDNRLDLALAIATVEGVVVDDEGKPLGGARVTVGPWVDPTANPAGVDRDLARAFRARGGDGEASATADDEGRFRVTGLSTNQLLEVRARATGHVAATSNTFRLGAAETRSDVRLELVRGGSVAVTFSSDIQEFGPPLLVKGRHLGDPKVEAVSQFARGSSVTLDGLVPGEWELTANRFVGQDGANEPTGPPQRVRVSAGERAEVTLPR